MTFKIEGYESFLRVFKNVLQQKLSSQPKV